MSLKTVEVDDVEWVKGIAFPRGVHFRQIIVTGPPCSGKSTLIQKLGGWPEEGYVDLAQGDWWRSRCLAFRPREVHFGIPFEGFRESHAVFDPEWLAAPTPINLKLIQIPPGKRNFFDTDWRRRFLFDFQLLPATKLYAVRKARSASGSHPVDANLTRQAVEHQCAVFEQLAQHFNRCGIGVFVRTSFDGLPRYVVD